MLITFHIAQSTVPKIFFFFFTFRRDTSLHEISLHTFFNLLSQGIKKEILVPDPLSPLNYEN